MRTNGDEAAKLPTGDCLVCPPFKFDCALVELKVSIRWAVIFSENKAVVKVTAICWIIS